jgi:hypothetical protein
VDGRSVIVLAMLARAIAFITCAGASACAAAPAPRAEPPPGPEPARLEVRAPDGAEVHVDTVHVGTAPLPRAIDAEPGEHRLLVTRNGYEPHVESVRLERGTTAHVKVALAETSQRKGAWAAIGLGGASVGVGIVLGVLSVIEHRAASDLLNGPIEELDGDDLDRYEELIDKRDEYRLGSGVAAGVGLAGFVAGAVLFAFDDRTPDVTVEPIVSPDRVGAQGTVRF